MTSHTPLVVLGPTASGKSDVAMAVAREASSEVQIVAVDAMQVYRHMDIGTAKPTRTDRAEVRHWCLDLVNPNERFTVAAYVDSYRAAMSEIDYVGAQALLVGGTGLYVTAVVDGLNLPGEWPEIRAELEGVHDTEALYVELQQRDPRAAERIEPNNRRRIIRALEVCRGSGTTFSSFGEGVNDFPDTPIRQIGIRWDRDVLRRRIAVRVDVMLERGLVDEVRGLLAMDPPMSTTARQALGYKEMIDHLEGRCSLEDARDTVVLRTQQFAVRQERWYRRDPRIRWVEVRSDPVSEVTPVVLAALS